MHKEWNQKGAVVQWHLPPPCPPALIPGPHYVSNQLTGSGSNFSILAAVRESLDLTSWLIIIDQIMAEFFIP